MAKKHEVDPNALSLSFTDTHDNFQTLKSMDTPNSVNLSVADIIGRYCYAKLASLFVVNSISDSSTKSIRIKSETA